jgi:hypothetical protein
MERTVGAEGNGDVPLNAKSRPTFSRRSIPWLKPDAFLFVYHQLKLVAKNVGIETSPCANTQKLDATKRPIYVSSITCKTNFMWRHCGEGIS